MYKMILVNIDEIWLKGKNRKWYLKQLKDNLNNAVYYSHKNSFTVVQEGPKYMVSSDHEFTEKVFLAIANTAGVASLHPCRVCDLSIESMQQAAISELNQAQSLPKTIRIETKRSNKSYPMTSMEITRQIGSSVFKQFQSINGSMKNPDLTVFVRVLNDQAFVTTRKIIALGGVPVGTSDRLLTMLSGGFDSPVASYLMFRRGTPQDLVFFHATPFVGDEPREKVSRLAQILARYQQKTKFYVIPFGDLQKKIAEECRQDYRTLFFRIYMIKVAELIARKNSARGIVMGDSLSQVSSQTMANINAVDACTNLSILRPLIGFNKLEILEWAKKAGTHDISAEPHDDACAMFAPKNPIIRALKSYCQIFCETHPFNDELVDAVNNAQVIEFEQNGQPVAVHKTDRVNNRANDFLGFD